MMKIMNWRIQWIVMRRSNCSDVMCFSESKILEGVTPKTSINIDGYQDSISMPTKATKGGVLIYVRDGISFVQRDDLDIQKVKELESCFVELQNATQS